MSFRVLSTLLALLLMMPLSGLAALGDTKLEDRALLADNPDPHFDHLGHEDGLSQISVNDLLQDQQGWIWVATQDGINRFDGYRFESFRHDPKEPGSPATSLVQDLYLDKQNRLWAMPTQPGILQYFDPAQQHFVRYRSLRDDPTSPLPAPVLRRAIHEDDLGRLWFGTPIGLQVFDPDLGRFWRLDAPLLADRAIYTLLEDRDGVLWIGTSNGLLRLRQPAEAFSTARPLQLDAVLPNGKITSLLESRSGNLWIGSESDGLYRFDPRDQRLRRLRIPAHLTAQGPWDQLTSGLREHPMLEDHLGRLWICTAAGLLRYEPLQGRYRAFQPDAPSSSDVELGIDTARSPSTFELTDLLEDHMGRLWIATSGGLFLHRPDTDDFLRYSHHPAEPRSLGNNLVTALFEDHSGNLWIGTQGAGVSRLSPYKNQFRLLHHRPSQPEGLVESKVFSVLVDSAGILWVGTSEGGLHRFDAHRQQVVERYSWFPGAARDLGSSFVRALLESRDGRLWVGTVGGGVTVIDRQSGEVVERYTSSDTLISDVAYSLTEFEDGSIWIGSPEGIQRLDPVSGELRHWRYDPDDPDSLPIDFARFAFEDSQRRVWVGTTNGLALYRPSATELTAPSRPERTRSATPDDPANGGFERYGFKRYRHRTGEPTSLSHDVVMAMHEDREGRLWVLTHGGGLNLFDAERGEFRAFRQRDGLSSDTLYAVLEDDHGHLWLSTNGGLSRFDPVTETFTNYGRQHGLGGEEFNGRAAYRTPAGELLFGGIHGLNFFYPDQLRSNPHPPPVRLTNFYILDERQPFATGADQQQAVEIGYRDNFFAFEFTALDFTSPKHNRYAYQLEGFDRDWIEAGTRRYASYTNLDGGDYTFRVRASNSDGVWSEDATAMRVRVVPPPWKTWWAYAGYLLIGLATVAGYVRYRVAHQEAVLRDRQRELERRALASEHRRQAEELERARDLQLSMLPPAPPEVADLEIATFMRTATEVGGDYYDFFPQADGSVFVVTGDATGHGLSAGMMVSMTKAALKSLAVRAPSALLGELNEVLRTMDLERLLMALNVVRLDGPRVTLSSAGMPPVLLRRATASGPAEAPREPPIEPPVEEILLPGLPLGSRVDATYRQHELELRPGDVLVLYSDGLSEWLEEQSGAPGYTAVARCLNEHDREHDAHHILDAFLSAGGLDRSADAPRDDITLVVIRYAPRN